MNATLINGGKIHRLTGTTSNCGVGKRQPERPWQTDLGEVTCQRCVRSLRTTTPSEVAISTPDGETVVGIGQSNPILSLLTSAAT